METFQAFIAQYGLVAIFAAVFCEYLNLPGFPAGIIMPLAGIWASQGDISFAVALIVSVAAGLAGSWCLYLLGLFGGSKLLDWYMQKFPKQKPGIEKGIERIKKNATWGLFVSRLIPVMRTLISIPAGTLRMKAAAFTLYSTLGITVWNLVFVGAGYFLGDAVFSLLPF